MMKSLLRAVSAGLLVTVAGLSALQASANVTLKNGHPEVYYVKQGDTLWDISSQFLESPWQWPELWHVNEEIDNPHLIYPGDVIRLVYVDGRPQLQVDRQGAEPKETVKMMADGSVVKLSPQVRVLPLDTAIPTIPMSSIQTFLLDALVVTQEDIVSAPYIIAGSDRRVIYAENDTVYARDPVTAWADLLQSYGVFRVGHQYVDPDTREVLGIEALQVGSVRTIDQADGIATFRINESKQDIRPKDRLFTSREGRVQSAFHPSAPNTAVDAKIIHFFDRLHSVARNDVVVINKGSRDGLRDGHVLEVMHIGERVKDPVTQAMVQLPAAKAGSLVLFRVYEKVSYALVIQATLPIKLGDIATNPAGSL
ncbi:MAG: peptigoglycan-binding protein LysM [Gammaproteobacteria bacterium HGW-Gammaproteobacteria-14]|nr:MAG: peptigoglycan-binding protein LysM [Gammaproteobacteria bacterium HGW-Gammaproteobacteria-14]